MVKELTQEGGSAGRAETHPAWGDYRVMVSRTRGQSKSICVNYDFGEWSILMT